MADQSDMRPENRAEHGRLERLLNQVEGVMHELYAAVDGADYPDELVAEALAEIIDLFGDALDEAAGFQRQDPAAQTAV